MRWIFNHVFRIESLCTGTVDQWRKWRFLYRFGHFRKKVLKRRVLEHIAVHGLCSISCPAPRCYLANLSNGVLLAQSDLYMRAASGEPWITFASTDNFSVSPRSSTTRRLQRSSHNEMNCGVGMRHTQCCRVDPLDARTWPVRSNQEISPSR